MLIKSTQQYDPWGNQCDEIAVQTVLFPSLFFPMITLFDCIYDLNMSIEHYSHNQVRFYDPTKWNPVAYSTLACDYYFFEEIDWDFEEESIPRLLGITLEEFEEWQDDDRYAGSDCGELGFFHSIGISDGKLYSWWSQRLGKILKFGENY